MPEQVSNPLTLVMKIKSPQDAIQLGAMLEKFNGMGDKNPIRIAMDTIGTVHFARFALLNNNTQLAIITSYDGDFDQYLTAFTNVLGNIFNQLFAHIEPGPPLPVQDHPKEFAEYVKNNNASPPGSLYCAYPQLTVKTILTLAAENS